MARQGSRVAEKIGERLRTARQAAGLTQLELANLAGVDPSGLQSYESGRAAPNIGSLIRLGAALAIDPGDFLRDLTTTDLPSRDVRSDGRRRRA